MSNLNISYTLFWRFHFAFKQLNSGWLYHHSALTKSVFNMKYTFDFKYKATCLVMNIN